jgi:hypothetical protein
MNRVSCKKSSTVNHQSPLQRAFLLHRHQQLLSFTFGVAVALQTQIGGARLNGHFANGFVLVNHNRFLVRNVFGPRDVIANGIDVYAVARAKATAHTG